MDEANSANGADASTYNLLGHSDDPPHIEEESDFQARLARFNGAEVAIRLAALHDHLNADLWGNIPFHEAQLRLLDAFGSQKMATELRAALANNQNSAFADTLTFSALIAYALLHGAGRESPGDSLLELVLRSNLQFRPDFYIDRGDPARDIATSVASIVLGSERFENVLYRYVRFVDWSRTEDAMTHESRVVLRDDTLSALGMPIDDWLTAALWLEEATPDGAHPPKEWPLIDVAADVASVDGMGRLREFLEMNAWTLEALRNRLCNVPRRDMRIRAYMAFLERPLVRLSVAKYVIASPRGVENAIGPGWYYRTLDWRRNTGGDRASRALTSFFGEFFEVYVFDLVERVAAACGGRSFREQRNRGRDSTDVVLALGSDLFFLEVVSGRVPVDVIANPEDAPAVDLAFRRLVLSKVRQLRNNVRALLAGTLRYDGLDVSSVRRIFPIVVQSKSIPRNASVHDLLDVEVRAMMSEIADERIVQMEILDAETLEGLEDFLRAGALLGDLIVEKTMSPSWRSAGFKKFVFYEHPEYEMRLSEAARDYLRPRRFWLEQNFLIWLGLARS